MENIVIILYHSKQFTTVVLGIFFHKQVFQVQWYSLLCDFSHISRQRMLVRNSIVGCQRIHVCVDNRFWDGAVLSTKSHKSLLSSTLLSAVSWSPSVLCVLACVVYVHWVKVVVGGSVQKRLRGSTSSDRQHPNLVRTHLISRNRLNAGKVNHESVNYKTHKVIQNS